MEALLEDLLVQASAVETRPHGQFDISLERGIARRRPDAIGVESLVEDQALIERLVVEEDAAAFDVHLAQAGIAADLIEGMPVAVQDLEGHLVEMGIVRPPGPRVAHGNDEGCAIGGSGG